MALPLRPVFALLANTMAFGVCWWPFRELDNVGLHALWATAITYLVMSGAVLLFKPQALREIFASPGLWLLMTAAGLANAAFNTGIVIGDVIRVVLLFYLMPVWAALLSRWLLDEPLSRGTVGRIVLSILGAGLVLYQPGMGFPMPASLADWLGLLGGMGFAANNVLLGVHAQRSTSARALAMLLGSALIPGLLAIVLSSASVIPMPVPSGNLLVPLLLLLALFVIANAGLIYGAARLPANVVATIMVAEVLFAALSAYWLANEKVGMLTLIGGVMIVGASVAAAQAASEATAPKNSTPRKDQGKKERSAVE
jgi:drug/metabolite transporter (DMT)-like permease